MTVALAYRAFAKVNLYLDVLDKRRDGYHNIETIFQSVGLADDLVFMERQSRVSLACASPDLDRGDGNLVVRAAKLLRARSGRRAGARIELVKGIPVAAGLAGGSSDASTTLIALNQLWEVGWSRARLRALARELGADVAYCIEGGTVAATGRGDALTRLPGLPPTWFVLVHPDVPVSTARVYASPGLGHSAERPFAGKTPRFRTALRALEAGDLAHAVFNRMEGPVFADHPQLADVKQRLLDHGCLAAGMSGSGATLFGLCASRRNAVGIAEAFPEYRTSVVHSVPACAERA